MEEKGKYIQLNNFSLSIPRDPQRKGSVWIEAPSGEAGSFEIDLLEKTLQEFFDKYF